MDCYVRYRPSYPPQILALLEKECGITEESVIADVGAGTGILTRLFLKNGNAVFAVEPNANMREAADRLLGGNRRYMGVNGRAEFTRLRSESVDLVTAGQAFHWFDAPTARQEFVRILKPGGCVALIWNDRRIDGSPFARAYEEFLELHGADYAEVKHRDGESRAVAGFFKPAVYRTGLFDNFQKLDFDGLLGRLLSCSYIPQKGHPGFPTMLTGLRQLFGEYQANGSVTILYHTRVYHGQLKDADAVA